MIGQNHGNSNIAQNKKLGFNFCWLTIQQKVYNFAFQILGMRLFTENDCFKIILFTRKNIYVVTKMKAKIKTNFINDKVCAGRDANRLE